MGMPERGRPQHTGSTGMGPGSGMRERWLLNVDGQYIPARLHTPGAEGQRPVAQRPSPLVGVLVSKLKAGHQHRSPQKGGSRRLSWKAVWFSWTSLDRRGLPSSLQNICQNAHFLAATFSLPYLTWSAFGSHLGRFAAFLDPKGDQTFLYEFRKDTRFLVLFLNLLREASGAMFDWLRAIWGHEPETFAPGVPRGGLTRAFLLSNLEQ